MKKVIQNALETPDGTILISGGRHDFKTYIDTLTGVEYMVDGGYDYIRRNSTIPKEELSLFEEDTFETIREKLLRGGRGINGDEPLTYVRLKDLNPEWLENLIKYEEENRPDNFFLKYYKQEKQYRQDNFYT